MLRLVISIIILVVSIRNIYYFPLLIPHIQYAGFFLMKEGVLTYEKSYLITYGELILLLIMYYKTKHFKKDIVFSILIIIPFTALPSFVNSYYYGNIESSIYLLVLLLLIPYYYLYTKSKMSYYVSAKMVDMMALSLVFAGVMNKIYQGIVHGPELAAYMHPMLYGLISRGGGMNASNHLGGMLLLLYPLIDKKIIKNISLLFLLICFSRGIYLILGVYFTVILSKYIMQHTRFKRLSIKDISYIVVVVALASILLKHIPISFVTEVSRNFTQRVQALKDVKENERIQVFKDSFEIFKSSSYQGIGLGGFYYGYNNLSTNYSKNKYSNAHNIYLTLLAENGLIFLGLFIILMIKSISLAKHIDKKAYYSLIIFIVYGLYSGQLYETGMGKASLYDYYYLVYVIAYINYKKSLTEPNLNRGQVSLTDKP